MDSTAISPYTEIQFLKQKCNALIERLEVSGRQIDDLINYKISLEESVTNLNSKLTEQDRKLSITPACISSGFLQFLFAFYKVIKNVATDNAFIPYTYVSKYARNYLKIEKNIFEAYIAQHTDIPLKNFKDYCCQMLFLKSEGSKCVFANDKIQIYYINKTIVQSITNDAAGD